MPKTVISIGVVIAVLQVFVAPIFADRPAGALTGKITDLQGFPLPGAFVYASSPSLPGIENYVTSDTGRFYFLRLLPGVYRISIDMPGFKTVHINDIHVNAGKTVSLSVQMETTEIEEEVTKTLNSPMLDSRSPKRAFTIDRNLLERLPGPKDVSQLLGLAPGFIGEAPRQAKVFSVLGSAPSANTWSQDGVNMTDPITASPMMPINFDIIEEIQVMTASLPAETYPGQGGVINVLTRPGGNRFSGDLSVLYTGQNLTRSFLADEGMTPAVNMLSEADTRHFDTSLSLGGHFMADRAWFFGNARRTVRSKETPFNRIWLDPDGIIHNPYDWEGRQFSGFFRLRTHVTHDIQGFAEITYNNHNQPVYDKDISFGSPQAATRKIDRERLFHVSGGITHIMSQNTFVDMKAGFSEYSFPLIINSAGLKAPRFTDLATGYSWGSGLLNDISDRRRIQAGASLVHIQENLIGSHHELKIGAEYEDVSTERSSWKENNLIHYYLDGSPYFYGSAPSPATGVEVGKGLVSFFIDGSQKNSLYARSEMKRLGLFLQDTMTFAGRVSLSLGLRFDRSDMRFPSATKGPAAHEASLNIGADLIKPLVDVNPYDGLLIPAWEGVMTWNTLSPRAGLNVDLSSEGTTILKASFSRYLDYLHLDFGRYLHPLLQERLHHFTWYDENGDGIVDAEDTFELQGDDFHIYNPNEFKARVASDASAPYTEEWAVGLHNELFKDFSVSIEYVSKSRRNILDTVLYDPATGREWYALNPYTFDLWIPFSTVVPGGGDYPDIPITVYMPSESAPAFFERIQNVPELERSFRGLELVFRKRMSNNWQFYGSIVWGKSSGNHGHAPGETFFTRTTWTPNTFINRPGDSLLDLDRPFAMKMLGTVRLPLNFDLTLYFHHIGGTPWARTVTIVPPDSWAATTGARAYPVTIFLEKPGTRRHTFYETLDMRLEKEFALGRRTALRVYADGLNILGNTYSLVDGDDGGFWFPSGENTTAGRRVLSPTFETTVKAYGTRIFQIGLGLRF